MIEMMIQPTKSSMIADDTIELAEIAPHVVHLAHHHGDDLDRRDRERGAEEENEV